MADAVTEREAVGARLARIETTLDGIALVVSDHTRRLNDLSTVVEKLTNEDRIAAEVAARIRARRNQLFSWPVKAAALIAAASAIFSAAWRLYQIAAGG